MKMKVSKLIECYWIVLAVGIFFILTAIYNEFGYSRHVGWNTFIKTTRELFLIVLLFKCKSTLNNTISILFCFGMIALSLSYIVFRFHCAIVSDWNYTHYFELMKNTYLRFIITIIIFVIIALIKYLNSK